MPDLWLLDLFCLIKKNSTLHPNVKEVIYIVKEVIYIVKEVIYIVKEVIC